MEDTLKSLTTVPVQDLAPAQMASQLVKLKELAKTVKERIATLDALLLEEMKRLDVLTIKTASYTLTRATRSTLRIDNEDEVVQALTQKGLEVTWDKKFSEQTTNTIKLLVRTEIVEGAHLDETPYISIRLPSKKDKE